MENNDKHPTRIQSQLSGFLAVCFLTLMPVVASANTNRIQVAEDKRGFVLGGKPFVPWGVNYDHDESENSRLLDEYWFDEWPEVVEDLREIKALGCNVVRIHLQVGSFLQAADRPNAKALKQLKKLLATCEKLGLYLNITGLACYHKQNIPPWFDALPEPKRWDAQAVFWEAVARTCADSSAVFCYDLMNEPVLPGSKKVETEWLTGELGGKFFVQRLALDLKGRSREEVAKTWISQMVTAIRRHDTDHLITLGVIPWALAFYPRVKQPFFYHGDVGGQLDFVSVHFYPRRNKVDEALEALKVYQVGKPVVIEEMFPLKCGLNEMVAFVETSRKAGTAQGWISFYWGRTVEEYEAESDIKSAIMVKWLQTFRALSPHAEKSENQR